METCSEISTCATAETTSSTSSWMNPPPPALPSARCSLRYAEFVYGSSTASVNKFPCESFNSERTSDVICPAVLYALDPTTGMENPFVLKEVEEVKEVKEVKDSENTEVRLDFAPSDPLPPLSHLHPLLPFLG